MAIFDLSSMILENQVQEFKIQWYFVPGYRDVYCVGSNGSVWSRYVRCGWGEWIIGGINDWRELRSSIDGEGYPRVCLCFNGVQTVIHNHRLVADVFLGPCPPGLECCHEDGNPQNNHVCNLRFDTFKNNQHDRLKHGTHNRGERHGLANFTQNEVDIIREEYATGQYNQTDIARRYCVAPNIINSIVNNRSYVDENFTGLSFKQEHWARGEKHGSSKLSWEEVDSIREDYATGKYTQKQLGEKYGVDRGNIGYIVRNETWVRP